MSIDHTKHSLFGASKVGGGYFRAGIRTLLRNADGLFSRRLPDGSGACGHGAARVSLLPDEMHRQRPALSRLRLQGKQVRDNIHSFDLVDAFAAFIARAAGRRGL